MHRAFDLGCLAIGIPTFAMLFAKEPGGALLTVAIGSIALLAWLRVQPPRRDAMSKDVMCPTTRQTGVWSAVGQPYPARKRDPALFRNPA